MTCPSCGYVYPAPEKKIRIEAEASTLGVISGEVTTETLDVTEVDYEPWTKRGAPQGSPRTVRVTYWCGLEHYSEWLCPEHTGYARRKFEDWFISRRVSPDIFVPTSVDEFLEHDFAGFIRGTKDITIRRVAGEKFPNIIKSTPGEIPEHSQFARRDEYYNDCDDLPF
jgi:DNA repair protein RadD